LGLTDSLVFGARGGWNVWVASAATFELPRGDDEEHV